MVHVDSTTEPRLERILSEIRTHRKRIAASEAARLAARRQHARLGRVAALLSRRLDFAS